MPILYANTAKEDGSVDMSTWMPLDAENKMEAVKLYLHETIDTFPDRVYVTAMHPDKRKAGVVVMSYKIEYPQGKQKDPRFTVFKQE